MPLIVVSGIGFLLFSMSSLDHLFVGNVPAHSASAPPDVGYAQNRTLIGGDETALGSTVTRRERVSVLSFYAGGRTR